MLGTGRISCDCRMNLSQALKAVYFLTFIIWHGICKNLYKRATLKKTKNGFQNWLSLNAGQKNCWMLQGEHSAILSTFIKLPVVIKIFILSIFEWRFYTGFTVTLCIKMDKTLVFYILYHYVMTSIIMSYTLCQNFHFFTPKCDFNVLKVQNDK